MLCRNEQSSPGRGSCDDPNRLHVLSAPGVVLKADLALRLGGEHIDATLDFAVALHPRDDPGYEPAANRRDDFPRYSLPPAHRAK